MELFTQRAVLSLESQQFNDASNYEVKRCWVTLLGLPLEPPALICNARRSAKPHFLSVGLPRLFELVPGSTPAHWDA